MRIIFNTSFIVNEETADEWVRFMREQYIKKILKSTLCDHILFTRVSIDQPEGKTFSLQLFFPSEELLDEFTQTVLPEAEALLITNYSGRYFCFSSTLTEIEIADKL